MVDDQICHQINIFPQFLDFCPASQAGINPGMIDRVKTGISAVNGIIKWENVNAAKQTGEWSLYQAMQCLNVASAQAICIGNELHLVFQLLIP